MWCPHSLLGLAAATRKLNFPKEVGAEAATGRSAKPQHLPAVREEDEVEDVSPAVDTTLEAAAATADGRIQFVSSAVRPATPIEVFATTANRGTNSKKSKRRVRRRQRSNRLHAARAVKAMAVVEAGRLDLVVQLLKVMS